MPLFDEKVSQVVDDRRGRQPAYFLGYMVSSRDVVQDALKNPWFMSTRQMAPVFGDGRALLSDAQKDGWSVVGPDYERPESRKAWTYVGMLIPGVQGAPGGKLEAFSVQPNTQNYVHALANRRETPTGIRVEQREYQTVLDTQTEFTNSDVEKNQPPNPAAPSKARSGDASTSASKTMTVVTTVQGTTTTKTVLSQPIKPPYNGAAWDMDASGKLVPTRTSNTGSLGTRIQTGTALKTPTEIVAALGFLRRVIGF